ncbi:MAG: LysR family transcriptional regulator [Hyphomicrobiaceae bacterium]
MNLRQLKTMIAIAETGSFSAAGDAVGLSHSAVSLQVKALEDELGVVLIDRSRRPPVLTDRGIAVLDCCRRMIDLMDEMAALGAEAGLIGSLSAGVVPSAMTNLVPAALARLREQHPKLQVRMHTGLSSELVAGVRSGELDVAISTAPERPLDGVEARTIVSEPLFVIAPVDRPETTSEELLEALPFVWFSRKTWAGQQIERHLLDLGVIVRHDMEVDSLVAITSLVSHGLGVSVVPRHPLAPPLPDRIRALPLGTPQLTRTVALLERPKNPKRRLTDALFGTLSDLSRKA